MSRFRDYVYGAGLFLCFAFGLFVVLSPKPSSNLPETPPVGDIEAEYDNNCPGELIFESESGQCLRMWQIPHRMEWWLSHQEENIEIQQIFAFDHREPSAPASIRYYVLYRKEVPLGDSSAK